MDARRVAIFIFPGVEELDFVGVYEVLAGARDMIEQDEIHVDVPLDVEVIATQNLIECANGLLVRPHRVTDDLESYELVIMPGGRGVRQLMKDFGFLSKVSKFAEENPISSVCSGALILAAAGILEGKKATTHANYLDELGQFCEVVHERVVEDGNVITAAGVTSSLALGLRLLQMMYGDQIVEYVASQLEIPDALNPLSS
jgi:transcriptional regulator GlxA family with amidase domain